MRIWPTVLLSLTLFFAASASTACGGEDDHAPTPPVPPESEPQEPDPGEGSAAGQGGMATETNAVPAPCDTSQDCPAGIACVFPNGDGMPGVCDVQEMTVPPGTSSAAPAPCEDDGDCPAGISCMRFDAAGPGFCDVEEMIAP